MSHELHGATQRLIQDIERKDRRFRIAQTVFMVLLIGGFVAGGFLANQAYQSAQAQRDRDNAAVIQAVNDKLDRQSEQLRCIVEFFTIEDRANLVITSVEDCFDVNRTSQDDSDDSAFSAEGEQSPNFTPGPTGPQQTIDPQSPGLSPVGPTPQQPSEPTPEPEPPAEDPPVEVLGIPVCVPLTGVCLRQ